MNQSLPDMTSLREEIVNTAQKAYREGMMAATSGNLSCYDAASGCIAITPSGMDYTIMKPEDIVISAFRTQAVFRMENARGDLSASAAIPRHRAHAFAKRHSLCRAAQGNSLCARGNATVSRRKH